VRPRLLARAAEEGTPIAVGATSNGSADAPPLDGASAAAHPAAPAPGPPSGVIRNRDDVIMLLDKICSYYERNEPSSPLPLLLQRCRRLAASSFLDIMKDLAPAALQQVEVIAGKTEQKK
jgi:type VI secretion system protein ImpA